uniref:Domain of unknown function DB domain-containing protein n=1 Tax=Ditylenchus dipsaci TaxID=166011 RepID=A0A915D640_9BILA
MTFTTGSNPRAPSMEVYLDWIVRAWDALPKNQVINSFKVCGLTNAGDGSEDDFIHCFKAHGPIPEGCVVYADPPGERFTQCCKDTGIPCAETCVYPPPPPSAEEAVCLSDNFNPFVKCYTNGKNNRACCQGKGVEKVGKGQCLDLCDGTGTYTPDWKYWACQQVVNDIADCNSKA